MALLVADPAPASIADLLKIRRLPASKRPGGINPLAEKCLADITHNLTLEHESDDDVQIASLLGNALLNANRLSFIIGKMIDSTRA
jgi:hypothetical protein